MNTLYRGEVAGALCLLAVFAGIAEMFILGIGKSIVGDVIQLATYLVVCLTYFVFLLAIQEIVKSQGNIAFTRKMRAFLIIMVVACLGMAPSTVPILLPAHVELMLAIATIVLMVPIGIASIQLARFFENDEIERSEYEKKAGKWLRISGWLMATVILGLIGGILSFIADVYLWRMIRQKRLHKTT